MMRCTASGQYAGGGVEIISVSTGQTTTPNAKDKENLGEDGKCNLKDVQYEESENVHRSRIFSKNK